MINWWHNFLYDPNTFGQTITLILVLVAFIAFMYLTWKVLKP